MNAVEIEEAISNLADQPFDPKGFPFAFLEAFGNKATTINMSCQASISGSRLVANNRKKMTNAAIFGALAR